MAAKRKAHVVDERPITAESIRKLATAQSFARGQEYADDGAVSDLVRRGERLTAEVEGSEFDPYQVSIRLRDGQVAEATCTCPYEFGGCCKHIVAVLLKFADAGTAVTTRKPVGELLAHLTRAQLIDLLERRADSDPELVTWIEAEIATMVCHEKADRGRGRAATDRAPVRERARHLLAKARGWGNYGSDRSSGHAEELQRLVEKAVPLLHAGNGRDALGILEPIAEAFVDDWLEYAFDSDEQLFNVLCILGGLMAEAILISDLSRGERKSLAKTLKEWEGHLGEYNIEMGFEVAIGVLETGWDDPALAAVLAGKRSSWPPPDRDKWLEGQLTEVRLRVLETRGRTHEYLNLARAAQARAPYALMLVKLQRIPEAVAYALKSFKTPDEALTLAQALREAAAHDDALRVADAHLALGDKGDSEMASAVAPLAQWLRDYAGERGDQGIALKAATVAFGASLSLEDFQAAQACAGANWDKVRRDLLARLARASDAYDRIAIYLSEGLIDEAVRFIGDDFDNNVDDETLMRLAAAAHASHPEWVIRLALHHATGIMEGHNTGSYVQAGEWLERAALAHEVLGQEDRWMACLDELIERYRRKYKLKPILQALRGR